MSLIHVWGVTHCGWTSRDGRRWEIFYFDPPASRGERELGSDVPVRSPGHALVSSQGTWWRVVVYVGSSHTAARVGGFRVRRYKEADGRTWPEAEIAARRALEVPRIAAALQLAHGGTT